MKAVVGAAIIRHGRVLAARRTAPAAAAGRWEFPGGKVEAGESAEQGLVREIREELGLDVELGPWLAGSVPVGQTHALTVALARIARDAVPQPVEHDQLRWVGPEELDELDWLEPDRPFLAELREVLLDGEPMAAGSEVVRVGRTVRRPTGPWTPAVHALLAQLRRHLVPGVPRVLGIDERGREVLELLPGRPVPVEEMDDVHLVALVQLLDTVNAAAGGFSHPDLGPIALFSHDELGPEQVLFEGTRVTGVTGWRHAAPTLPLRQLAHLAWAAAPMTLSDAEIVRRLELIAEAFSGPSARELLAAVGDRVRAAVAQLDEPLRSVSSQALLEFEARRPALDAALAENEERAS